MNQFRRAPKAISSAAALQWMVREVKQSPKTTISELQSLVTFGVTMSANPPKDVTSMPTNCLDGMPKKAFPILSSQTKMLQVCQTPLEL